MAYATQADIEAIYSPDALYVADRDGDGAAEAAAVTRALQSASDEIDSYIGLRYQVPLDPAALPGVIRQACVDIALYRLALGADVLSEEHRRRYEDAVTLMRRIGKGEAMLPLPDPAPAPGETPLPDGVRPIVTGGPDKVWTRAKTRGL